MKGLGSCFAPMNMHHKFSLAIFARGQGSEGNLPRMRNSLVYTYTENPCCLFIIMALLESPLLHATQNCSKQHITGSSCVTVLFDILFPIHRSVMPKVALAEPKEVLANSGLGKKGGNVVISAGVMLDAMALNSYRPLVGVSQSRKGAHGHLEDWHSVKESHGTDWKQSPYG